MPISLRAAALRTALERMLDEPVRLISRPGATRLYAVAPDAYRRETWRLLLDVLGSADKWGSTDASGRPEVWAEVRDES
ncbi:hypothetical protein AB0I54_31615 [Streptomyces sp. NPDC050625]|uniref:hypothetical protein n=1 Tax=Streptomyces sp. NPDC050625 TaxID=3154629 RepID=UPI003440A48B